MVLLAFSVHDQVEKYGAYVGIACFFGLAILSLLYFAQAREIRRLRDWAGRMPERDLEAAYAPRTPAPMPVAPRTDAARRVPAPARVPVPRPPQPALANDALKPEEAAALAFARAAGVASPPHPPQGAPVPAPPLPAAAPLPVAGVAAIEGETGVEEIVTAARPVAASNGGGAIPGPSTPAARRPPAPLASGGAPSLPLPPPRRSAPAAAPAPRRAGTGRSIALVAVLGVVVVVLIVFLATRVLGGGSSNVPNTVSNKPAATATATPAGAKSTAAKHKKKSTSSAKSAESLRPTTTVEVLNATSTAQLAANFADKLSTAGYGADNVAPSNYGGTQQTSSVLYASGNEARARDVAKVLGIGAVRPIDAQTSQKSGASGKEVVVVVGADKSSQ